MNRILCLLICCCFLWAPASQAQVRSKTKKAPAKTTKARSARTRPSAAAAPAPAPEPPAPVAVAPPSADTAKDTSKLGQVVQTVHDSVKAEVKAPIVQVPVTLKSLIIPGVMFAYGAIALNNKPLQELNHETKEWIWEDNPHNRIHFEDYTLLLPAATVYVLNLAGVKGQNNLIDRSILYGMSNLVANGLAFGVKAFGAELRPDSSDNASFPSGHTAEAFVSAEFMRLEYRGRSPWYGIAGYTLAASTAFLRMYNNKHWLSDVVAGAGVGIVSTRFSYWFYPILKHAVFGSRKVKSNTLFMPTYQQGAYGFALIHQF